MIKERFVRVGIASLLAPLITWLASALPGGPEACVAAEAHRWFGMWSESFLSGALAPLALTMLLFLGPLVMAWVDRDEHTPWRLKLRELLPRGTGRQLQMLRNMVIGPGGATVKDLQRRTRALQRHRPTLRRDYHATRPAGTALPHLQRVVAIHR